MNKFEIKFKEITGINFKDFYKDQKPKLTWFLSRWTKDYELAEDFANEAFMKALESIDTYKGEKAAIHTWVYTIAQNFVKKDYQNKQKMPSLSMDKEITNNASLNLFLPYNDGKKDIIKYNELCKKADIIKEEIRNLPDKYHKYRNVLLMREIENLTYEEIAQHLNINLSTIKSQIKKGREIILAKVINRLNYIDEHGLE